MHIGYREHTNDFFNNLNIIKWFDFVKLKTCLVMYKVKKMIPPNNRKQPTVTVTLITKKIL